MTDTANLDKALKVKRSAVLRSKVVQHVLDRTEAREAGIPDTFAPFAPLVGIIPDALECLYRLHPDALWGVRKWLWDYPQRLKYRHGVHKTTVRAADGHWEIYWVRPYGTREDTFGVLWGVDRQREPANQF